MIKNLGSLKKRKKVLSSVLFVRNIKYKNILLISGVIKKYLKLEKESTSRLVRSCFINFPPEIFDINHLVKVENHVNFFNSCEKFDRLIRSKNKLSICSVYYKKFVFTNRKHLTDNSLFWLSINIKLLSILIIK